jgi:outer membrane protein OmpA-like peptidoglycan-associated protein
VSFDVGRANIKSNFAPVLDQFANGLRNNPNAEVRIIGHTDNTGSDAINNPLSVERATSTRDYLVARGVNAGAFRIEGRGSHEPVADNNSDAGRAQNRRVEIYVGERGPRGLISHAAAPQHHITHRETGRAERPVPVIVPLVHSRGKTHEEVCSFQRSRGCTDVHRGLRFAVDAAGSRPRRPPQPAAPANSWTARLAALKTDLEASTKGTGVVIEQTADNQLHVVIPNELSFDTGRSNVKRNLAQVLDKVAEGLKTATAASVRVVTLASSTADFTSILSNTRARCTSTVRTLMASWSAMSLLGSPRATSRMTSRSRSVSSASRTPAGRARAARPARGRLLQRLLDAVDQRVVGKRLLAEVERAALDHADRRGHVGVAGQEDDRHHLHQAARHEPLEQRQAAQARHAHVQQQAAGLARLPAIGQHGLEILAGGKALAGQVARAQQPGQRFAHASSSSTMNTVASGAGCIRRWPVRRARAAPPEPAGWEG